jgi:hypothetical protein
MFLSLHPLLLRQVEHAQLLHVVQAFAGSVGCLAIIAKPILDLFNQIHDNDVSVLGPLELGT